jgi:hypothetical protein
MAKLSSTDLLNEKIRLLEIKQADEAKLLKEQLYLTYDGLKPINLLKNSAKEYATSAELRETILESSIILISGLISKKLISLTKGGPLLKLLASFLQLGSITFLTKYSDKIQEFILKLIERFTASAKEDQQEEKPEEPTA